MKKLKAAVWTILFSLFAGAIIYFVANYIVGPTASWAFQHPAPYEEIRTIWLPERYSLQSFGQIRTRISHDKILGKSDNSEVDLEQFKLVANDVETVVGLDQEKGVLTIVYYGFSEHSIIRSKDAIYQREHTGDLFPNATLSKQGVRISWYAVHRALLSRIIWGSIWIALTIWGTIFVARRYVYFFLLSWWNPWGYGPSPIDTLLIKLHYAFREKA